MDDRELLKRAAKAAGHEVWTDCDGNLYTGEPERTWNPLTDDGDALRLAVNLKMDLKVGTYDAIAEGHVNGVLGYTVERIEANAESSIRRAIVRAAAEIGGAM